MELDRIAEYVEISIQANRVYGHVNLNGVKVTRSAQIRLAGFPPALIPVKRRHVINSLRIDIIKDYLRESYIPTKREDDSWPPNADGAKKPGTSGGGKGVFVPVGDRGLSPAVEVPPVV